ncbi:MAG: undecaprenyl-diphosphate phosphatase [bacterium]
MESIILVLIITQIIIESLPISSSGHVALVGLVANKLFGIQNTVFPDLLDHLLHGTALAAILIVFSKDWFFPFKKVLQTCTQFLFKSKPLSFSQKKLFAIFGKIVGLVIVADLVTSIFYFVIKIGMHDFFGNLGPNFLLFGFIITMLLLLSLSLISKNSTSTTPQACVCEPFDLKKAVILGTVQGCALLPGISRFASTYVAGCWLNIGPRRAFQISFLIHLPLIIAKFMFLGIKDILKNPETLQRQISGFGTHNLFLILSATIIAILALNLCYKLAVKNKLWWFGFYMLIPIIILIACNW